MRLHLTETAIAAAGRRAGETRQREELTDRSGGGLRLRVTPAGGRTWIWGGRDRDGRARRFVLGHHPTMGVAEARDAARSLRSAVQRDGADPVADMRRRRSERKDAAAGIGTLAALLELYGGKAAANMKSWPDCRRRIAHVFATFLDKPLSSLRVEELQIAADAHPSAQSAAAAVRYVRPVLKWGAQRGYVAAAVADLHPPATVARRDRVLSGDELAALLPALANSQGAYAHALRFMLWTLARREEVGRARWRDLDVTTAVWTIPTTKSGMPHVVPLPRQATAFLLAIKPKDADRGALIFCNGAGNALANWDRETKAIMAATGITGWTRHDLRRTGATILGEMGELPDIVEAALNHTSIRSPLAATYNRSRYRPQVAAALQRLADSLDGLEAGCAEVVPLFRAKF